MKFRYLVTIETPPGWEGEGGISSIRGCDTRLADELERAAEFIGPIKSRVTVNPVADIRNFFDRPKSARGWLNRLADFLDWRPLDVVVFAVTVFWLGCLAGYFLKAKLT